MADDKGSDIRFDTVFYFKTTVADYLGRCPDLEVSRDNFLMGEAGRASPVGCIILYFIKWAKACTPFLKFTSWNVFTK